MYTPYNGPAGPSTEQKAQNTLHLFEMLQKAGIPCTMDNGEYAKDLWGGDEQMIVLERAGRKLYVSYDRWGFCGDGGFSDLEIDQLGLDQTFSILQSNF